MASKAETRPAFGMSLVPQDRIPHSMLGVPRMGEQSRSPAANMGAQSAARRVDGGTGCRRELPYELETMTILITSSSA